MRTDSLYTDTIHGLTTIAACKTCAYVQIRSKCKEYKLAVPEMDHIEYVRQLTAEEMIKIHNNAH